MKINESFRDDVQQIKEVINNMPLHNFNESFLHYIIVNTSEVSKVEAEYINSLRDNIENLIKKIDRLYYEDKSREELIDCLIEFEWSGLTGNSYEPYEFFTNYYYFLKIGYEKVYNLVINYMMEHFINISIKYEMK